MSSLARQDCGRRPVLFMLLLAFAVCPGAGIAQASTQPDSLDAEARIWGLSLIWKEAAWSFPYFDELPGLDWDAAYRQYLPRVLAARTTLDYYRELQRFMALLEDGHSRVQMPDSIQRRQPFSSPWIELRAVAGHAMVANVATELADSVPIGSEVVGVDGSALDAFVADRVLPFVFASAPHSRLISAIEGSYSRGYGLLVGPPDRRVVIDIRKPDGAMRRVDLARDRFSADRKWMRPPETGPRDALEVEPLEHGIVRVAINTFGDDGILARLDERLPELRLARGVILDLRDNGGGSDVIAADVLARFTDRPLVGTGSKVRVGNAYYRALGSFGRAALERALPTDSSDLIDRAMRHYEGASFEYSPPDTMRPEFDGERVQAPVAVLVGRGTGSAAENFIVRLPDESRFFTVGTPTAGSTGQPLRFALPGGGLGQIVTRAALLPDGTPVVRNGIRPDHLVEPTIEDVRTGADPVLAEALRLLTGR